MVRLLLHLWNRWFGEPLRKVEAESLAYRLSPEGRQIDTKTIAVVLTAAVCLTVQNYTINPDQVIGPAGWAAAAISGPDARREVEAMLRQWHVTQSQRLVWSGLVLFFTYTALPALVIKLYLRERLNAFGTGIRGIAADWPIYLAFAAVMLPLVWLCSAGERFQDLYPFYRINSRDDVGPRFFRWEVVYALQFIGLEFFFRGFLVHGTKHRFGVYSIFLMVIPYCMIHIHKPAPEMVGSILAGVALGLVSLVTRSIWPGAFLHILVAWGMDASVLFRRGLIG
jgi:membrane protease YdiL (CAAX protease family)